MLLYHFPLINDYSNKGFASLYTSNALTETTTLSNSSNWVTGGKIAQTAKGVTPNFPTYHIKPYTSMSFCLRCYVDDESIYTTNFLAIVIGQGNQTEFRIGYYQGKLRFGVYKDGSLSYPIEVSSSTGWHDVVATMSNGNVACYVDSDNVGSITGYDLRTNSYYTLGSNFNGQNNANPYLIQDVRIYDYALSQAEINEYSRALVVHYPLQGNELNPSVLKDVSGFGNNYTLQGTNSYQLDSARGINSLHTTDTAIYTQTPISSGYTTSFWCKYNGEWKHLCNNGSKYVDGVVNASQYDTIYATLTASGYDIVDYRVYATSLSAEDIKNLYNSPISVSNQHQTMAFEFKENPLYPSKYWRTPTYAEMNYILNTRTNASSLRTLGRVEVSSGTYVNGCFLLPDDWVTPQGITIYITTANYTTNNYSLADFKTLENNGAVFFPCAGRRIVNKEYQADYLIYHTGTIYSNTSLQYVTLYTSNYEQKYVGKPIRLCHNSQSNHSFSTSANTKIDFAPANLQYHCTQHIWRFAEHSYDFIGADNENIRNTYNGWIDLFGYGTSGVNLSPTEWRATNSLYASGDISNTDNDWGINEIQSYEYNVKNFALNKNGIVQHNELRENDSDVNGCYNDKLITNELIEN